MRRERENPRRSLFFPTHTSRLAPGVDHLVNLGIDNLPPVTIVVGPIAHRPNQLADLIEAIGGSGGATMAGGVGGA